MRNAEATAWRMVATRIALGTWRGRGLCREVRELYRLRRIVAVTLVGMETRLAEHLFALPTEPCGCCDPACTRRRSASWAFRSGEAEPRILAALFLALEAEDEEWEASHA